MTRATTEKFAEMTLSVEFTTGTFAKVAGIIDVKVTRTAQTDATMVPDVNDESLPLSEEVEVTSIKVKVSGSGVWAQQSHGDLMEWFYSGQPKNVKLTNVKAAVGEPEVESGPALLTALNNSRSSGKRVDAEIEIEFVGTPTTTNKAA